MLTNNSKSHVLVLNYSEGRTYDRNHNIKDSHYYFRDAFPRVIIYGLKKVFFLHIVV